LAEFSKQIARHDPLYTHVTGVRSRAVTHFDWTIAIMAVGVVLSILAALYIGL
jgi:hypothetical protein